MAKWVTHECYGLKFINGVVELHYGHKVVEHRKVKPTETEIEVANSLIEHYKRNGGYDEWVKVDRLVEGVNVPLKYMKSETDYLQYLNGRHCRALKGLQSKLLDTALNDIWEGSNNV